MRTQRIGSAPELNELFGGLWAVYSDDMAGAPGLRVAARFTEDSEGRKALTGLVLLGDPAITASSLRRIAVSTMENQASLSGAWVRNRKARQPTHADELRKLPPLHRDGVPPEEFAARVAEHYKVWARVTPHPAAAMSEEWGVKAPTMAGWIREARLRGLLPPARGRSKAARA